MKKIKRYWGSVFGLVILLVWLGGSTIFVAKSSSIHIFQGPLELVLSEEKNAGDIHFVSGAPLDDELALKQPGYTFQLQNLGKVATSYTIYLDEITVPEEKQLHPRFVKYHFTKNTGIDRIGLLSQLGKNRQRILDMGILRSGEVYCYQLQFWLSLDAGNDAQGKTFAGKIRVETEEATNSFAE